MARDKNHFLIPRNYSNSRTVTGRILPKGKQLSRAKIGYVPRLRVGEGVFLGDAIVTNRDGKAYVHVINSNNEDRELIVPVVDLQEIEQISDNGPLEVGRNSDINVIRHESKTERVERIRQTLRLDH